MSDGLSVESGFVIEFCPDTKRGRVAIDGGVVDFHLSFFHSWPVQRPRVGDVVEVVFNHEHKPIDVRLKSPPYEGRINELRKKAETQTKLRAEAEQRAGKKNVAKLEAAAQRWQIIVDLVRELDPRGQIDCEDSILTVACIALRSRPKIKKYIAWLEDALAKRRAEVDVDQNFDALARAKGYDKIDLNEAERRLRQLAGVQSTRIGLFLIADVCRAIGVDPSFLNTAEPTEQRATTPTPADTSEYQDEGEEQASANDPEADRT